MRRVAIGLSRMLAVAAVTVLWACAAWAVPLTFVIDHDRLPQDVLTLQEPGQMYLTINTHADLFADVEENTPISNGAIANLPNLSQLLMDDLRLASGPFSLDGVNGEVILRAMLTPEGGFLSSPLLVEITLPGVTTDQTNIALNPVPEPTSLLLLGPGLVGLAWLRRRYPGVRSAGASQ